MIRSFVRKKKDEERKRITKAVNEANLNRLVDKTKKDKPQGKKAGTPLDVSPASLNENEDMDEHDNVNGEGEQAAGDDNEPEIVMEEIKEEEMGPNDFQRGRRAARQGFKTKADKAAKALFSTSKR